MEHKRDITLNPSLIAIYKDMDWVNYGCFVMILVDGHQSTSNTNAEERLIPLTLTINIGGG